MMIRETKTSRMTIKPHINALGEREDRLWADPIHDSRKSVLYR
jgi:hypothetical protein